MKITADWLASFAPQVCDAGIIHRHVAMIRGTFGDGFELTRDNLVRAARAGLWPEWLGRELLKGDALRRFDAGLLMAKQERDDCLLDHPAHRERVEARQATDVLAERAAVEAKFHASTVEVHRAYQEAAAHLLSDILGLD